MTTEDSASGVAQVTVAGVDNNALFNVGDILSFNYAIAPLAGVEFRHAEVTLRDFNDQEIYRVHVGDLSGDLSLKLPRTSAQETYQLRVRGYFDDNYHFSETEVGIRVAPRNLLPEPSLTGLPSRVMPGSVLNLQAAASNDPGIETVIEVQDSVGNVLAAASSQVTFTVPAGPAGTVKVT